VPQQPKTNTTSIDTRDGKRFNPFDYLFTMDLQYRTLKTLETTNVAASGSAPIVIEGPRSAPYDGVYVALSRTAMLPRPRFTLDLFGSAPLENDPEPSINEYFATNRFSGDAITVRLRTRRRRFRLLGGENG
jgi:hypothetical protein